MPYTAMHFITTIKTEEIRLSSVIAQLTNNFQRRIAQYCTPLYNLLVTAVCKSVRLELFHFIFFKMNAKKGWFDSKMIDKYNRIPLSHKKCTVLSIYYSYPVM